MQTGALIIRGIQLLWVIILVALLGNVIYDNKNGHMSAINYSLFAAVIAWVACLMGIASTFISFLSDGIFTYALLALDALSIIFTFVAAIVLPAKLHAVDCGGNLSHRSRDWIGFGSSNPEKRCRELQASTVFMWFLWVTLIASLVLGVMRGRRSFGGSSGGSSAPHMSQVRV